MKKGIAHWILPFDHHCEFTEAVSTSGEAFDPATESGSTVVSYAHATRRCLLSSIVKAAEASGNNVHLLVFYPINRYLD